MKRRILSLVLLSVVALLVAGCGGGEKRALSGSVTDVAGNFIPGADIYIDGVRVRASLMNGTYKIATLSSGPHNVEARAMIDGSLWVGTRAVNVYGDGPTMNINIVIGWFEELGTIEGVVTDYSNDPIPNARVIAIARYPQDRPADEASVISKVAVTDSAGRYDIPDLPASITVNGAREEIIYDVIASSAGLPDQTGGFENQTKTVTVAHGYITPLNFRLASSTQVVPTVPPGWTSPGATSVISYTVPTAITTRAAESAYDAIKSCISERSRKAVALKRRTRSRAPSGALIENNVIWYYIWNGYFGIDVPSELAGFTIYRGTTRDLRRTAQFRIDFFRDPGIVAYSDTSADLNVGITYWYGVTAISTSYLDEHNQFNPLAESEMSYPASVTPLGKLTATFPRDGAFVDANHAVFSWQDALGAVSYRVFIYETYPIVDAMFTPQGDPQRPDHLPAWGQSAPTSGTSVVFSDPNFQLQPGHTYWWVVMGSDDSSFDNGNAYTISQLRSFEAR